MSQMLYKNRTDRKLLWRCGTGPGSWVDYKADPGEFAIAPAGYREQMRREGFTPADELPEDERPNIPIAASSVAHGKVQRKVFVEDPEDGEKLERAVPTRPLAEIPRPVATRPTAPPAASSRPQIDLSAAPADGPMALANVEPLPDLPPPPADEPAVALSAKAVLAGDMSVETPGEASEGAVAPAGAVMPAPPAERETKPEKPSSKDKAKK